MAVDRWEKAKGIVGVGVLLSVLWAGDMAASIPGRIAAIETNQALLIYRMEQLEKAVLKQASIQPHDGSRNGLAFNSFSLVRYSDKSTMSAPGCIRCNSSILASMAGKSLINSLQY